MERLPVTAVTRPAIVVVLAVLAAATLYGLTGKKPCLADHLVQQNHTTVAPSPGNNTFQDHSADMRVILLATSTPMPNPLRAGPATAGFG